MPTRPIPSRDRERAAFFDALAWRPGEMEGEEEVGRLRRGLARLPLRSGQRVLDLGCGRGILARELVEARRGVQVVAADASLAMVAAGKRAAGRAPILWLVARAEALPLRAESVDRCFLLRVWPHFSCKRKVLRQLARILKPGGTLDIWHLASRQEVNRFHRTAGGAVARDRIEPMPQLVRRLAGAGFQVVEVRGEGEVFVEAAKGGPRAALP